MTARDLLAEDRLCDAIDAQRVVVAENPRDAAARLFLFELLTIAGRFLDANAELLAVESDHPDWMATNRAFRLLLRAERRRQHGFKPTLLTEPPMHLRCRWNAVKASRIPDEAKTIKWADQAEAQAPTVRGHVDGREFEGLRDADDRFANAFEFLTEGRYCWIPHESVRKVVLLPAEGMLDTVLRPAEMTLQSRPFAEPTVIRGHLPLVYPGTTISGREDSFLLGRDADFTEIAGMVVGIGERVLTFGEEEIPLGEIRQVEIRK
jgi:type VI secretion system protein ImpE